MYKYIKIYNMGFDDGIKDAKKDSFRKINKKFTKINDTEIKSKLYDIGYIKGYRKFMKSLLIKKKV